METPLKWSDQSVCPLPYRQKLHIIVFNCIFDRSLWRSTINLSHLLTMTRRAAGWAMMDEAGRWVLVITVYEISGVRPTSSSTQTDADTKNLIKA